MLPSKTAFSLYSISASVAVVSVGVLADGIYRLAIRSLLSTYLPYGITVDPSELETLARIATVGLLFCLPLAYLFACRRIGDYRLG